MRRYNKIRDKDELNDVFFELCKDFIERKSKSEKRKYTLTKFSEFLGERLDIISRFMNGDIYLSFDKISQYAEKMNYHIEISFKRNKANQTKSLVQEQSNVPARQ
jgi:hypothetical protein